MKEWKLLDSSVMPDGKPITLHAHDHNRLIQVDGDELMSTRYHDSEEQISYVACAGLRERRKARVLIGGLGFGYTLRAALNSLAGDAEVIVAELLEAVIKWNTLPLDKRLTVIQTDVAVTIAVPGSGFDAIILDVDNGPYALSTEGNARLYKDAGLLAIRAALRPKGCVAFWSAAPSIPFEKLLRKAGFKVDTRRRGRHAIFLATALTVRKSGAAKKRAG